MQRQTGIWVLMLLATSGLQAYNPPAFPYEAAAGQATSTAISFSDPRIVGWAKSVVDIQFGSDVADEWRDPEAALGPATAQASGILVLGRGGSVVLGFSPSITDGQGEDFLIFENAFRDTFLELAYLEVSSDGDHFVRFPNYSLTANPVPAFGEVFPTFVHGYASKYRTGFGTPFDLATLASAYAAALEGTGGFSDAFRTQLIDNFPHLDLSAISYVRLVDIIGDGSSEDCEGFPVYDPYPTVITAGFDLDAAGVLNQSDQVPVRFDDWSKTFRLDPIAGNDSDGDHWSQYLEYLMGSNPTDPASVPFFQGTPDPQSTSFLVRFRTSKTAIGRPGVQVARDSLGWTVVDPVKISETDDPKLEDGTILWQVDLPESPKTILLVRLVANPD